MLSEQGFDLWADGYDKSVGLSDEDNTYPFAGYKAVLGHIYREVMQKSGASVLDVGFGTGVLTSRLYKSGCTISGQDFSSCMIELAQSRMPGAQLYQGDFTKGLVPELDTLRYDFIISTYALHHLTDRQKADFIPHLLTLLNPGGQLLIGDVAFAAQADLDTCRLAAGDDWDEEEFYFVAESMTELKPFCFTPLSHCAGVLAWKR
ncbi:MAG: class I SAM-dependent methyltransferase [Clostridia bacterium]|nr:class I SAM-dependent methyltransferase [Clostridia bacterium]